MINVLRRLITFLVFTIGTSDCNTDLKYGYSKLQFGYRLDRKMINSFDRYSILDCVEECLRTVRCKSISYYKGANYCEINHENARTASGRFIRSSGWIYSERKDWSEELVGPCPTSKCSINEKCSAIPFGAVECILSDCGVPNITGADIDSPGRWDAIGLRRQMHLECLDKHEQIGSGRLVCQSNGKWREDLKCEYSWMRFQKSGYKFFSETKTWSAAEALCKIHTSSLLAIETEAENIWINQNFNEKNVLWLGASDHEEEGTWIWSHNKENFHFKNWNQSEPNNLDPSGNDADCAILVANGKWFDRSCTNSYSFVCEHNQNN